MNCDEGGGIMIISTHKISEGITLTTRSPSGGKKRPAIILCHGFCGIREILLPQFAEVFTQAGFVTITFDYRDGRSEEHTSELQSRFDHVCRLLLEKKKKEMSYT